MSLFELDSYKIGLNKIVEDRRKTLKGLSRKLAEHLGVHPTMVSQVLTGMKDFTEEQMILVCEFLGVPKLESKYLLILLQQERAGSKKLKDYFQEQKNEIRKKALQVSERVIKDHDLTEVEKAIFYSSWIYPAVHLMTTLTQEIRFEDICQKFNLTKTRARDILDFLIQTEMVNEHNGKFTSGPTITHLEKKSPFLIKHHTNWRLKAIQAAENLTDQELMYSANFSVSKKDFDIVREDLMQTIQKFLKTVAPSPAEDIAQLNLDFFWVKN